jgi:phospholipase/lecithinase/hemolysin
MLKKSVVMALVNIIFILYSLVSTASTVDFNQIFVIGDSLSDTGNTFTALAGKTTKPPYSELIPSAAYESKRLSNGPVWVEYFASKLGMSVKAALNGGTGFAFSGARTGPLSGVTKSLAPTLINQTQFLIGMPGKLPSDALYIVWGGNNDVRDIAAVTTDPTQAGKMLQESINNLGNVISSLAAEGATQFLVPNLPNLEITPIAHIAGPATEKFFSQISTEFNQNLALMLPSLEADLGIDIIQFNVEEALNTAIENPEDFSLKNVTDHCIILGGDSCSNPEEYLFWDGIHPTTAAHEMFSNQALAAVIPLPPAFSLFVTAITLISITAKRSKAA